MLREEILKAWEKLQDKAFDMRIQLTSYQNCFVITDILKPSCHSKRIMINGLGYPNRIITSQEIDTDYPHLEVNKELAENYSDENFIPRVVMMWRAVFKSNSSNGDGEFGPTIEEVD